MQRRDFAPGFMVRLQQKDLRLALAAAQRLGVQLPTTALVHLLLKTLEAQGGGDEGTQAIVKTLEALAAGSRTR
jgi:3-hydroxyisobutyrate dehydrogenase